jgi:Ca2+-binding EF-hand superfamily protein
MHRFARIVPLALAALLVSATGLLAQTTPPAQPSTKQVPTKMAPSFKELDTNGDGRVSLDEIMVYATKKSTDLRGFYIKDVDKDSDGKLTQQELKAAGIKGLEGMDTINLKDLDKNGDGYVSREELEAFVRKRYANELHRADADADGVLHPREFAIFRF